MNCFVKQPDSKHSCFVCGQPGIKSGLHKPNKICKTYNTAFDCKQMAQE